mmetsp:Transcript_11593/g.31240  ORF Transcript_11593/g.31240 Transcript_11593/m.31240 type:complete len:270 (-) Transcript_11593:256-1065(-)
MFKNLFNPDAQKEKARERKACGRVKEMVLELIPPELQDGIIVSVQQMACGDPGCAPIDTIINLTWQEGLSKPIKVGLEAHQVDYPDLQEALPPVEVITSWSQGEDAKSPELRFANGLKVQCRVGADPVTGWAAGTIVALWYREEAWPSGAYAPYQIKLDDGRLIFGESGTFATHRQAPPPCLSPPAAKPPPCLSPCTANRLSPNRQRQPPTANCKLTTALAMRRPAPRDEDMVVRLNPDAAQVAPVRAAVDGGGEDGDEGMEIEGAAAE